MTSRTELVEAMTAVLWPLAEWDGLESNARLAAQAALSAIEQAGLVVVPMGPTDEMVAEGGDVACGQFYPGQRGAAEIYAAMIEAGRIK